MLRMFAAGGYFRELRIFWNKKKPAGTIQLVLTGAEGIEPSSVVLETIILPMNYAPNALFFTF